MKDFLFVKIILSFCCVCMISVFSVSAQRYDRNDLSKQVASQLALWNHGMPQWNHLGKIKVDSVSAQKNAIKVFISTPLSYLPMREAVVDSLYQSVKSCLGKNFEQYTLGLYSNSYPIEQLIPNFFRSHLLPDVKRQSKANVRIPVVQEVSDHIPQSGLYQCNIALWHSHGWYFESSFDRWEWQRARLFGTVEDMATMSYVVPYLVPMLENAGASVFLPRERDIQRHEVIVDNDGSSPGSEFFWHRAVKLSLPGFLMSDTLVVGDAPFEMGSSFVFDGSAEDDLVTYLPDFKERGEYAVYVSYPYHKKNSNSVMYDVRHLGGITSFVVNQTMGCGTWIYLGTFLFDSGKNSQTGCVVLRGRGKGLVAADAVRFGGGMGNVARKPAAVSKPNQWSLNDGSNHAEMMRNEASSLSDLKISGKPRFMEAARYYLQYSGAPTTVYNMNNDANDYNDDYQSRGEWVNFLKNKPGNKTPGLGLPIDLAFAFHTDAGVTANDSVIGTLGIFSTLRNKASFTNGQSKLGSRDLSDLIQTQIVDDVRQLYNQQWTRRGLWDKQYSEAWRPDVPTMLLELLSHQNLADMRYGLDPRFRFDVSRAIYKGMLRFLAAQYQRPYVVQPLAVNNLALTLKNDSILILSWQPVPDPLEATAMPSAYKIYRRIDDAGFDNGFVVTDTFCILPIQTGKIYSFKVAGINAGGEGFPSEVLSAGILNSSAPMALVVNGFDRISGPALVDEPSFAGVRWWEDAGVADNQDFSFTGAQYNFNRKDQWLDDDNPGWGSSYGDMEGKIVAGNRFDYPIVHGKALMANGYSFVSVSDESFVKPDFSVSRYRLVDVILGEEKTTPLLNDAKQMEFEIYTPEFIHKIKEVSGQKLNLLMSGAYVGTDLVVGNDTSRINFAAKVLHIKWRTNQAAKTGVVCGVSPRKTGFDGVFHYSVLPEASIYAVESPDGIEPSDASASTIFRYSENNVSAGVAYRDDYGVVTLGFPFETVVDQNARNNLMNQILLFFDEVKH